MTMPPRRTPLTSQGGALKHDELPGYVVNWAARLFGQAFARRMAASGVSLGQWPILLTIFEEEGLTQAELVRRLDIEQPTVANTLKRMERDGLVYRRNDPSDLRRARLHLTDRAAALVPELMSKAAEVNQTALAGLSPRQAQTLLTLLHHVIQNLRGDATDADA